MKSANLRRNHLRTHLHQTPIQNQRTAATTTAVRGWAVKAETKGRAGRMTTMARTDVEAMGARERGKDEMLMRSNPNLEVVEGKSQSLESNQSDLN